MYYFLDKDGKMKPEGLLSVLLEEKVEDAPEGGNPAGVKEKHYAIEELYIPIQYKVYRACEFLNNTLGRLV